MTCLFLILERDYRFNYYTLCITAELEEIFFLKNIFIWLCTFEGSWCDNQEKGHGALLCLNQHFQHWDHEQGSHTIPQDCWTRIQGKTSLWLLMFIMEWIGIWFVLYCFLFSNPLLSLSFSFSLHWNAPHATVMINAAMILYI